MFGKPINVRKLYWLSIIVILLVIQLFRLGSSPETSVITFTTTPTTTIPTETTTTTPPTTTPTQTTSPTLTTTTTTTPPATTTTPPTTEAVPPGGELALEIVAGEVVPEGTITILVTLDGSPIPDAIVIVKVGANVGESVPDANDDQIGRTDENGLISIIVPANDKLEIKAILGELSAELVIDLGQGPM